MPVISLHVNLSIGGLEQPEELRLSGFESGRRHGLTDLCTCQLDEPADFSGFIRREVGQGLVKTLADGFRGKTPIEKSQSRLEKRDSHGRTTRALASVMRREGAARLLQASFGAVCVGLSQRAVGE